MGRARGKLALSTPARLLDRVREAIRARHYSRRTEKAYVHWIRRFIVFHNKRHPAVWTSRRQDRTCPRDIQNYAVRYRSSRY